MLDSVQDTVAGRSISIGSFYGGNESRDSFIAISVSKPFWDGKDEAAVVSEASNL